MECKGNACLGIHIKARHHIEMRTKTMHLRPRHGSVTYLRARHALVRHVTSRHIMVGHVRIMHVRKMNVMVWNVMVWNVREMHVWAEISGQGITWQGT
jgi:hypothetical protein